MTGKTPSPTSKNPFIDVISTHCSYNSFILLLLSILNPFMTNSPESEVRFLHISRGNVVLLNTFNKVDSRKPAELDNTVSHCHMFSNARINSYQLFLRFTKIGFP